MSPIIRIDITADGYATLYNLQHPTGQQIDMIGTLAAVLKRVEELRATIPARVYVPLSFAEGWGR
jgi:hypothetical protein